MERLGRPRVPRRPRPRRRQPRRRHVAARHRPADHRRRRRRPDQGERRRRPSPTTSPADVEPGRASPARAEAPRAETPAVESPRPGPATTVPTARRTTRSSRSAPTSRAATSRSRPPARPPSRRSSAAPSGVPTSRSATRAPLRYGSISAGFVHHTVNANDYTRGAGPGHPAQHLRLPREVPRLERHRLQLPRRPVRPDLGGPLRRHRQGRRRRAHPGLQRLRVRDVGDRQLRRRRSRPR